MKISKLITKLEEVKKVEGDIEVWYMNDWEEPIDEDYFRIWPEEFHDTNKNYFPRRLLLSGSDDGYDHKKEYLKRKCSTEN